MSFLRSIIPSSLHPLIPSSLHLVILSSALLYVLTAAPSITELFSDSLEFQLVLPTLGVAHPTGYPFYTLLGALWSRVLFPFGNWAWRINLLSALTGAVTVTLLYCTARNLFRTPENRPNLPISLTVAALFAVGPVWWSQATIAEVYTLHCLFVILFLYLISKSTPPSIPTLALLIGLSLTHHRMTLLLISGLLLYLILSSHHPLILSSPHLVIKSSLHLVTPLALYLLIPLRASMGVQDLNASYINTWSGFWDHVLARAYSQFLYANPLAIQRTWWDWLTLFEQQLGWLGLLLVVLAMATSTHFVISHQLSAIRGQLSTISYDNKRPLREQLSTIHYSLFTILVTHLIFAFYYQVDDIEVFLLPAFLCCTLLIGDGISQLQVQISKRARNNPRSSAFIRVLLFLLCISLVLPVASRAWPQIREQRQTWEIHDYVVAMAKVDFPPESRVIGLEGEMTGLKYMQQGEGLAGNATALVADDPMERTVLVEQMIEAGYPTYLTWELPGIETAYSFSGHGPLVRVWPRGSAQVGPPTHPLQVEMAEGALNLAGYDLTKLAEAGGQALQIVLYWQPTQQLTERYKVSLRLLDQQEQSITWSTGEAVTEDHFLLRQVSHSDQWLEDEVVRDVHRLKVPQAAFSEGGVKLQVILYQADTGQERGRWQVDVF